MTDDDDYIAISAREMADWVNRVKGTGNADLVKTTGNSLSDSEAYFTTLATIAECNRTILRENFPDHITKPFLVEDSSKQQLFDEKISEVWECLTENIEALSIMLADKTEKGDDKRREIRRDYLLGKPVPQMCLFTAFVRLAASNGFSPEEAAARLNKIDWRKNAPLWENLLMFGNTIRTKNAKIAADIIYYVAGGKHSEEEKKTLLEAYRNVFPERERAQKQLPPKIA